ncbi:MAG: hypothetical protein GDA55_05545 [Cellvibrionales bacterium]|nr:hypothetical protein [Cellvibrionales bacterium]
MPAGPAIKTKNDQCETQLSDIENELRYHEPHFRDKVAYCNRDTNFPLRPLMAPAISA